MVLLAPVLRTYWFRVIYVLFVCTFVGVFNFFFDFESFQMNYWEFLLKKLCCLIVKCVRILNGKTFFFNFNFIMFLLRNVC